MDTNNLFEILKKNVDEKGLAKDLAKHFILPFLQKIVDDSANKFDDAAFGYVKEFIEKNL